PPRSARMELLLPALRSSFGRTNKKAPDDCPWPPSAVSRAPCERRGHGSQDRRSHVRRATSIHGVVDSETIGVVRRARGRAPASFLKGTDLPYPGLGAT